MSQHCPICKARLWSDPWLSGARLKCPRCGNEFRPRSHALRWLVLAVILAAAVLTVFLPAFYFWIVFMAAGLIFLFWYFPRLIQLRPASELSPSEGMMRDDLDERDWEEGLEKLAEHRRFRMIVLMTLALALLVLMAIGLKVLA